MTSGPSQPSGSLYGYSEAVPCHSRTDGLANQRETLCGHVDVLARPLRRSECKSSRHKRPPGVAGLRPAGETACESLTVPGYASDREPSVPGRATAARGGSPASPWLEPEAALRPVPAPPPFDESGVEDFDPRLSANRS